MEVQEGVCVCVYIYIYIMRYYSAINKNEILSFEKTWIDLEGNMLNKIRQTKILFSLMPTIRELKFRALCPMDAVITTGELIGISVICKRIHLSHAFYRK